MEKKSSSLRSSRYQQATFLAREHTTVVYSMLLCIASLMRSLAKIKIDFLAVWISLQDRGPFYIFLLYK